MLTTMAVFSPTILFPSHSFKIRFDKMTFEQLLNVPTKETESEREDKCFKRRQSER